MTRPHTTHYESCGCAEAERDALKAEVASLRETNAKLNRRAQASEAAALRVAQIEQRIAEHKRGKPLGRIEAQFAIAAAETDRDALKAQVERLREEVFRAISIIQVGAHPDSERPAVFKVLQAALASTPAQSRAAHDADVRAKALRLSLWAHEASDFLDELWQEFPTESATWYGANVLLNEYKDIKALAERAPEVER